MIATENITDRLNEISGQARELIVLLEERRNPDGTSSISLKEAAAALRVTRPLAKQRLGRLIDFGVIEKAGFNSYRVIHTDLDRTPLGTVSELVRVISDMPNATYKEQAAALGITVKELETSYGLLVYLLRF